MGATPPGDLATTLARASSLGGIGEVLRAPLAFLESLNQTTLYNCRNTLALLEGTGVRCPAFDGYVDNLVHYVRAVHAAKRQKLEEEAKTIISPGVTIPANDDYVFKMKHKKVKRFAGSFTGDRRPVALVTRVPVAGSTIADSSLVGEWCAEVFLDDDDAPIARRRFDLLEP